MHHHVSVVSAAEGIRPDPPLCAAVHAAAAAAAAAATGTARRPASIPSAEAAVNLRGVFYYFFVLFLWGGKRKPPALRFRVAKREAGHHYLCIHLCSHWNNSPVPAVDFPTVWRSAPPQPFLFNGMSRWKRQASFCWDAQLEEKLLSRSHTYTYNASHASKKQERVPLSRMTM